MFSKNFREKNCMKESRKTLMTKKVFREVLLELLQSKPLSKITITEICEKADLNRSKDRRIPARFALYAPFPKLSTIAWISSFSNGRQILSSQRWGIADGATGGNSPRFVGIVTRPNPPDIIRKIFELYACTRSVISLLVRTNCTGLNVLLGTLGRDWASTLQSENVTPVMIRPVPPCALRV